MTPCLLPRNRATMDYVCRTVVYDVGHPWRISPMCDSAVTGLMPRQRSRDPNNLKKKLTGGEGPVDHHPITFALQVRLRGTRTDINPRVSAPVHQPVRLLLLFYPVGFHSVPLGRILAPSGSFSYPSIAASASTPLLARLPCKSLIHELDVSLQHLRARASPSSS